MRDQKLNPGLEIRPAARLVLPVGGVKEKVVAATAAGLTCVMAASAQSA